MKSISCPYNLQSGCLRLNGRAKRLRLPSQTLHIAVHPPIHRTEFEEGKRFICSTVRSKWEESVTEFSSQDDLELSVDPYHTRVEDVMIDAGMLKTTGKDNTLKDIIGHFDTVSGLPVLENNVLKGVITRKDILAAKDHNISMDEPVEKHMTSPAITIREQAHVAEAASLMLAHKVHRLCVVDESGQLVGIVSRANIFRPSLSYKRDLYKFASLDTEEEDPEWLGSLRVLEEAEKSHADDNHEEDLDHPWEIKYLYDGECQICLTVKRLLQRNDKNEKIKFVDISTLDYSPQENAGIEYEDAMESIHALLRDGTAITGPAALRALYRAAGLGWAAQLAELPGISMLFSAAYAVTSKFRIPLGGMLDSVIAAQRMQQAQQGVEHCGQTEEGCDAPAW